MPRQSETGDKILKLFDKYHLLTPVEIGKLIPSVNKTTIYRNLDTLVAEGKLKVLVHDTNSATYELASHPHHHFICSSCNAVIPIEIDERRIEAVFQSPLYSLEDVHIDLHGLCHNCKTRKTLAEEAS